MATAEDYAQGLLDQDPEKAAASTYDAETRDVNQETDTVQGQLESVLDSDSKYIGRARTSAQQYSASRGLLNSSMAAQAGEAAAIDAAMPIAQQDADTNFRQGLENQAAENTSRSTNAQLETNVSTSNAANDAAARNQALQTQGALEQQGMQDTAAMERTQFSEAAATERTELSEEAATFRTQMGEEAATFRANLQEMAATDRQNIIAMVDKQTNDARINANVFMNNRDVAAEDRQTFSTAYNEMTRQNYVEITKLSINPDLSTDEKSRLIAAQNARYTADTELLSGLYDIPIEMTVYNPDLSDVTAEVFDDIADEEAAAAAAAAATHTSPSSFDRFNDPIGEEGSCFTGDTKSINLDGQLIRVDEVKVGDVLMGAKNIGNTVLATLKVPVAGRTILSLDGTGARFTGEHPFLMTDGSWGAFDADALRHGWEIERENGQIIVDGKDDKYIFNRELNKSDLARQIKQGDHGVKINGLSFPLYATETEDTDDFVYTMILSGDSTWNAGGVVVSGMALGSNHRLVKV